MKNRQTFKICFVSHGLAGGGMERALVSLANHFAEKNNEITILNIYRTEVFFDVDPRIKIVWPEIKRGNRVWYILRLIPFLRNEIKQLKPDVIFSFGETFNSYVILATRFLNIKVVLSNRMWPSLKLGFPAEYLNRLLYRFANGVIAQTNTARQFICKRSYNSNIIVIPNAVKPIEIKQFTKKKQIISVGRISKAKGHIILLKAFAKVAEQNWTLHLIGDGPERNNLETEAEKLGVTNRVIFHGHLKNFNKLLGESEIFVLPSFYEGFPNALLEAMSVPLACISSNCVAGPSDIIEHGKNGMLVETGNVDELAVAIERLIADKELRENIAKEAYKVRETYKFDKIANQYLDFIQKTINNR